MKLIGDNGKPESIFKKNYFLAGQFPILIVYSLYIGHGDRLKSVTGIIGVSEMKTAFYKKSDSSNKWFMNVNGIAVTGERVLMKKRDGTQHEATVGKIISQGRDYTVATIEHANKKSAKPAKSAAVKPEMTSVERDDSEERELENAYNTDYANWERQQEEAAYRAEMERDAAIERMNIERTTFVCNVCDQRHPNAEGRILPGFVNEKTCRCCAKVKALIALEALFNEPA